MSYYDIGGGSYGRWSARDPPLCSARHCGKRAARWGV